MKHKNEIITSMCYTYRQDYGLLEETEQQSLWTTMSQIFDNDIAPYMKFKTNREDHRKIKSDMSYSRIGADAMRRG
jgi:hypothetical protein